MRYLLVILWVLASFSEMGAAQFQNQYQNQVYSVLGVESGLPIYEYRDTVHFKFNGSKLIVAKLKSGYVKSDDTGLLYRAVTIPYSDISGTPTLATVATTGNYNDLTNKPTIPSVPVQSVNGRTGNVVVFDSNYNNLLNKPTLFDGQYSSLSGKPTLFSGSYTDLSNKPTIPAQINPIAGTNMAITGVYPNITFNSTATASMPVYNKTGLLSSSGVLITDTFTVSSATPTVSFASILATTGKSNFKIIDVTGYRTGGTATGSPQVSITTLASNSATFVVTQQNTATVSLSPVLPVTVLSGLPLILVPDPANIKLSISLIAY